MRVFNYERHDADSACITMTLGFFFHVSHGYRSRGWHVLWCPAHVLPYHNLIHSTDMYEKYNIKYIGVYDCAGQHTRMH
jgi:hypothetical protein